MSTLKPEPDPSTERNLWGEPEAEPWPSPPNNPPDPQLTAITDAHLRGAMLRSMRLVALLGVALAAVLLLTLNWQTAALLLIGALISATGLWEWQKLITLIQKKLDNAQRPGTTRVLVGFFARLLLGGAVLYVTVRYIHGSVYALLGGLALAALALAIEAWRLIQSSDLTQS